MDNPSLKRGEGSGLSPLLGDNLFQYTEITPDFKISELCYITYPCQHNIIINGEQKRWGGVKIYDYLRDNNLFSQLEWLEKHFGYCAHESERAKMWKAIQDNKIEYVKNSYLLSDTIYKKYYNRGFHGGVLGEACKYNRVDLVKWLIEEKNFTVGQTILVNCCDNPDKLKLFKYLHSASNIDLKENFKMTFVGHGGNHVLSHASFHGNLPLLKYLMEELEIPLTNSRPLMEALGREEKDITDTIQYLTNKTLECNIKIEGRNVLYLKKKGLYEKFLDSNLICNPGAKVNMIVDIDTDDKAALIIKNDFKRHREECFYSICYKSLSKSNSIHFGSWMWGDIYSICIRIKTTIPSSIEDISISFNGQEISFSKCGVEDDFQVFKFEPIDPLHTGCLIFTDISLLLICKDSIIENPTIYINELTVECSLHWNSSSCHNHGRLQRRIKDDLVMIIGNGMVSLESQAKIDESAS